MKCFVGIDLGSTTTKAVILDEERRVLGRGITNSRSNYDVACDVARHEAFVDARFRLFSGRLDELGLFGARRGLVIEHLRRGFRLEQNLRQMADLHAHCAQNHELLRGAGRGPASTVGRDLGAAFDEIFAGMRARSLMRFEAGERAKSDFFRDVAGADYIAEAKVLAEREELDFEWLLGIYDKSIIAVEGEFQADRVAEALPGALTRAAASLGLDGSERDSLRAALEVIVATPLTEHTAVGTGYGRARLPFPRECIRSEILCHGLGAHATFPRTRTVLDIGGQDTKAIQVDSAGIVTSFQMNDRCAAGCGRYLGYIADEMNLGLHELGPMASCSTRPVRINSTCTVFAGAELRDRLAMGQRREDILAGLHRAIMLRAMSLLARSGGVNDEFAFTGGVANNQAAVAALRELVDENYQVTSINISAESIYTGALGAAIFAWREGTGRAAKGPTAAMAAGGAA
jgi:benzoyl-CoA reductase subunit A